MSRKSENTGFLCAHCGAEVQAITNGSYRNHCPLCLYSLHVDESPGDRMSDCHGLMKPVGSRYCSKKGWQIVHRCQICGVEKANRTAFDTAQPDSQDAISELMTR